MSYTINGVLKDSAGTVVSGAKVSILNDSSYSTTDSNGVFSLTNVREGSYLVKITLSNSTIYTGTLRVVEGSSVALNNFATTHVAQTGNNLASLAYTYASTQVRVKAANPSLTNDTVNTNLTVGNTYNIPTSFQLTGGSSPTIATLTINLGTSNNIASMTIS